MKDAFDRLFNDWPDDVKEDDDLEYVKNDTELSVYDPCSGSYLRIELWSKEVE